MNLACSLFLFLPFSSTSLSRKEPLRLASLSPLYWTGKPPWLRSTAQPNLSLLSLSRTLQGSSWTFSGPSPAKPNQALSKPSSNLTLFLSPTEPSPIFAQPNFASMSPSLTNKQPIKPIFQLEVIPKHGPNIFFTDNLNVRELFITKKNLFLQENSQLVI